jgi:hypothetical protein
MRKMTYQERELAELRLVQIVSEILNVRSSVAPMEVRFAKWEKLLTESISLQQLLEDDDGVAE